MTNYARILAGILLVGMVSSFRTTSTQCGGWANDINADKVGCSDRAAIVFLHGMGDDAATGWSALKHILPSICPRLGNDLIHYVFPQAPNIGVTLNGGERVAGWFDILDWPIDSTTRDDPIGQLKAVRLLEDTVEKIEREEGIPAHRIVVGGFAQGAAVAMLASYSRCNRGKEPYAACACLSGWLPMRKRFPENSVVAETTPLFWAHGLYDENVLIEQQVLGIQKLRNRGINVTARTYPVGHESFDSQEIIEMAEFLDDTLFPKVDLESILPRELTMAELLASVNHFFDNNEGQLRP
mmetsp:Transcript_24006/g.43027  ORF Transcript_24006/g.43027 Transcript_24006/m.43027 type:complete len:297 (-) Transcript_24006:1514-2404(-)